MLYCIYKAVTKRCIKRCIKRYAQGDVLDLSRVAGSLLSPRTLLLQNISRCTGSGGVTVSRCHGVMVSRLSRCHDVTVVTPRGDAGLYACLAVNAEGRGQSRGVRVLVERE